VTRQGRAVRARLALIRSAAGQFETRGYVQANLAEIELAVGVPPHRTGAVVLAAATGIEVLAARTTAGSPAPR
jgi:hypothetical protein